MSRAPVGFRSLEQWLQWQESLHPASIDLGLERVGRVAERLRCTRPAPIVITVGGTNGKGSCAALLQAILLRAGYRVGCYTSPHLFRYNERLHVQGQPVSDRVWCSAFEHVDRAREADTLTYFEFGTLAALDIMGGARLDVAVLEVGLGGRLDAVNIVDPDVALITSIGVDHVDWLGPDRESIGREKAGIFRAGTPAVCGDPDPPSSVRQQAERLGCPLHVLGADYTLTVAGRAWHWQGERGSYRDLPPPQLLGAHQLANAASVLMVLETLERRLPVSRPAIAAGLRIARLPGRVQLIPGKVEQVVDVSHNAQAAQALADALQHMPLAGKTHAVLGMMRDKDARSFVRALDPRIERWHVVGLPLPRARAADDLARQVAAVAGGEKVDCSASVADALDTLRCQLGPGDRLVVCGSFYTVAQWAALQPVFD